jgi:RHS repeat-associated protein
MAVDDNGNYVTYNGSTWTSPVGIDANWLVGVSCTSATFCAAVDNAGSALTYSSGTWTTTTGVLTEPFAAISCVSTTCKVADTNGDVATYNGSSWSSGTSFDGTTAIDALSCATATMCEAGDARGVILGYNGTNWTATPGSDEPASSADTTTLSDYDPDGNVYCSVSANAYAKGPTASQCPTWQKAWIGSPPNPTGEYSSTPSATQANNVTLSFANADGDAVQSTNPDVDTTVSVFDPAGRTYCTLDASNLATWLAAHSGSTYPYSCPSTPPTTAPATGSDPGYVTTIFDAAGRTLSSSDADGNTTKYGYDAYGDQTTVTDANGHVTTSCYYWATSSCASSAPAGGGAASMLYSTVRPDTTSDPSGEKTYTTYFPGGATDTVSTPAGVTTSGYDADGDLLSTTYSGTASGYSTPANVSYTYYPDGSRKTMTDGTGTTTYAYDGAGDVTSQVLVAGSGSGLTSKTMDYTYDAQGQLASVVYPTYGTTTNPTATYTYNTAGQMSSVTDWSGNEVAFSYDQDGNQTDQANEATAVLPGGTSATESGFDAADESTYTYTVNLGFGTGISPEVNGKAGTAGTTGMTQAQLAKQLGLKSGSGTDPLVSAGLVKSSGAQSETTCTPTVNYFAVLTGDAGSGSRNGDGDITSSIMADSTNCGAWYSIPFDYSYDPASRVVYNGEVPQGSSANNLSYDPAGNVTKIFENDSGDAYTDSPDAADEVLTQTPVAGTGGVASTYTYDTLGDQITDTSGGTTATYGFNQVGQMTSYAKSGATTTYLNNGDGLQTSSKPTSGVVTQLIWDTASPSLPTLMSDSNDYFVYGTGTTPVEQYNVTTAPPSSNPTFLNYSPADGLSSYLLSSTSGAILDALYYDLFGTPAGTATSNGTVFGYQGQYADVYNSGLTNMRARWYEAGTGTFSSVDPDLSSTNEPYEYAGDDPVNESDPTGLISGGACGWLPGCGVFTDAQNGISGAASSAYSTVNRAMIAAGNNFCANIKGGVAIAELALGCPQNVGSAASCSPNDISGFGATTGGNLNGKPARYFKNAGIDPEDLKDEYGYSSDGDLAVESGTGRVFVGPKNGSLSQMEPTNFRIVNGKAVFEPPTLDGGDGIDFDFFGG